jgi:hypothetical protein
MAVDSWTPKPRLWIGGEAREGYSSSYEGIYHLRAANVTVWEEDGGTLKKIVDFDEIARNQVGEGHVGAWSSSVFDHVNCDPTREELYWRGFRANPWVLDLKTGRKLRQVHMPGSINDLAFDKRGYLHIHLDPGFFVPGVVRMNPANEKEFVDHLNRKYPGVVVYREVPYDYGVEVETKTKQRLFVGAIPVKDQPGAKFFQDGFGVNMRGDMAVQSNIYFMPRMDEESYKAAFAGLVARVAQGGSTRRDGDPYQDYLRSVREKQKMGEELYFIPRRPGIPLSGATVWTYDATGQLRQECAVLGGGTMAGVQIDEDGDIYFVTSRQRLFNGRPFLSGHKKHLGSDEPVLENDRNPFTACLVKARSKAAFLLRNAVVPMDAPPGLPADMVSGGPFGDPEMGGGDAWANGVEWIYAGAGPVVASGCTCASMRPHLDWFKRSYVPEAYRHSIGVLDTAGNLILHLGSYGNHDDALKMAPGTADIRMFQPRFLSGTDHYLAFDDWGERLVVLRLGYHAEATAPVK